MHPILIGCGMVGASTKSNQAYEKNKFYENKDIHNNKGVGASRVLIYTLMRIC